MGAVSSAVSGTNYQVSKQPRFLATKAMEKISSFGMSERGYMHMLDAYASLHLVLRRSDSRDWAFPEGPPM